MTSEQPLKNPSKKPKKIFFWAKLAIIIIILLATIIAANYFYNQKNDSAHQESTQTNQSQNIYITFLNEIYDKIQTDYWNKINDEQLSNLYKLAAEKITGQPIEVFFNDKAGVNAMARKIMSEMNKDEKKEFTVNLANIVLANLEPFGRGGLFSQKQEEELKNRVQNIDPQTDLYQILEVSKDSSIQEIEKNYNQKSNQLNQIARDKNKTEEEKQQAQQQLALVNRAYETLGNEQDKQKYEQAGIESSVESRLITPEIFYIHIKKMSPTSFEEFQYAADSVNDSPASLNTLILDLRDNVGGSVDLMQWFLGPFIGLNNLGYEFYHQDEYQPFKTVVGWLPSLIRYKKVIILINEQSQSSAEVMAAALKKYNVGILIGTTTKGWGTIEKVFPLENQIDEKEKYSMFLVHSLTLRDDNQPIEGHGVDPHINIENEDWEKQLSAYFNYPKLITAVKNLWNEK